MYLTKHNTADGARWALEGRLLPEHFALGLLLEQPAGTISQLLAAMPLGEAANGDLLAPLDPDHEVWASGVTYLRSREARKAESSAADVYEKVYDAERPELFFKAIGWRVVGHGEPIRVRRDSRWNVPEPEMVLVLNRQMELVGVTAGNDVSSRDIEGENPLYLPQAKVYEGSCALGPGIQLLDATTAASQATSLPIRLEITRDGAVAFTQGTTTAQIKRGLEELASYLGRELPFPRGAFLMTGTGIVPPDTFSLSSGDHVRVTVGPLTLENPVE